MLQLRKASERGRGQMDWLKSWFSFSFDQYFDARHTRWGPLRVINEDYIAPLGGFDMHPHRDMEIISYIISGSLKHKDNIGNESVVRKGQLQRMTAGRGITHSEFNPDSKTTTHMLQVWIMPDRKSVDPSWEQRQWDELTPDHGGLILLASADGRDGSATIGQDALIWQIGHTQKQSYQLKLSPGRKAWLQIAEGDVTVRSDTETLRMVAGDGLAVENESLITLDEIKSLNALWFDLP